MRFFQQKKRTDALPEPHYPDQSIQDWSDESLIRATASGSTLALEALYDRYHQLLYSFAYRMIADYQIAEDLLQEAFFAVWQHAGSYAPHAGSVRTWLCAIMHNRAIDYIRKVKRSATLRATTLEGVGPHESVAGPDVWEEAWGNIQGERVRAALMQLPKEQLLVIELAYFGGWTHTEIAEGCQIPLGTVKARMRLGLQRMRRILAAQGMDERL